MEEIWYESVDGFRIQGWIVKPPDFDPSRQYPLILHIHGGPHAMYDVGFSFRYQHFASEGYVTLYTNPRGSTGYGTDDYMAYPGPALATILFLMFVGGSSGSTAGGMKVERIVLMVKRAWVEVHEGFRPAVVRVIRMGRQVVDESVLADVRAGLPPG